MKNYAITTFFCKSNDICDGPDLSWIAMEKTSKKTYTSVFNETSPILVTRAMSNESWFTRKKKNFQFLQKHGEEEKNKIRKVCKALPPVQSYFNANSFRLSPCAGNTALRKMISRSSRLLMLYRKTILKNFAKFKGRNTCNSQVCNLI